MFQFKQFQLEDYARAALHDGAIIAHDTGGGKTIGMYVLSAMKVGFESPPDSGPIPRSALRPLAPVLFVAPGDLHGQIIAEGAQHFRASVTHLDCQETFLRLSTVNPTTGRRELPAGYYITSYTELASNGVEKFVLDPASISEAHVREFFDQAHTMQFMQKAYRTLRVPSHSTYNELTDARQIQLKHACDDEARATIDEAWTILRAFHPRNGGTAFEDLDTAQQRQVRKFAVDGWQHRAGHGIGEERWGQGESPTKIVCVHSPTLADLCCDTFACVCVDEGVRMKGEDTLIGIGVRRMNPPYRYVFTATPVKNRLPDVFRLAWWATGGRKAAHARFPYDDDSSARDAFAAEFNISERNLSKEARSESKRRFVKLTPQVCNIHRIWKMFAPTILRRRKKDFGLDIVSKTRQIVRVPMGKAQARTYRYHLDADYLDINGRPAIGAQLQALRIAAANPCSTLLKRMDARTGVSDFKSSNPHTPKLHAALNLIAQVLHRGEQFVVFSAFHDSLDQLGTCLKEAGVPICALDGRVSQKKRATLAAQFKLGPPKAGLGSASQYAGMLAGIECMAEGHSFPACNNVILMCYSWAYDKFEQAINRVHRLNSLWPVNVYPVICDGSIDRRLESLIGEKGDAAELVLDGKLAKENTDEVNLWELLQTARDEFDAAGAVDEATLAAEWPRVRLSLSSAAKTWSMHGPESLRAGTNASEQKSVTREKLKDPDKSHESNPQIPSPKPKTSNTSSRPMAEADVMLLAGLPLFDLAFAR